MLATVELPGVVEGDMSRQNGQRKHGTSARRRSKGPASRIWRLPPFRFTFSESLAANGALSLLAPTLAVSEARWYLNLANHMSFPFG